MSTMPGTRRPAESNFKQQKLKAWQPILSPKWVITSFLLVGAVFIPIGVAVLIASGQVLEKSIRYDELCQPNLNAYGQPGSPDCVIPFEIPDSKGWEDQDVYVYYQLDNFYQNHRRYVQSRSAKQLSGDLMSFDASDALSSDSSTAECKPFFYREQDVDDQDVFYYPCGLVARSLFNDTLLLRRQDNQEYVMFNSADQCLPSDPPMPCKTNPVDVAWPSDVDKKYKAPGVDWLRKNCKYIGGSDFAKSGWIDPAIDASMLGPEVEDCGMEVCGRRVLDGGAPNNGIYNCWHNVSDEDFIVWMRIAALPSFKKLYRKIPSGMLSKGTTYELVVNNNFPVGNFSGKKTFVLSTTSWIGGKNDLLGWIYIVVGGICVFLSLVFLAKNMISPRTMGDPRYLNWK